MRGRVRVCSLVALGRTPHGRRTLIPHALILRSMTWVLWYMEQMRLLLLFLIGNR
jgi:hypothetical protein